MTALRIGGVTRENLQLATNSFWRSLHLTPTYFKSNSVFEIIHPSKPAGTCTDVQHMFPLKISADQSHIKASQRPIEVGKKAETVPHIASSLPLTRMHTHTSAHKLTISQWNDCLTEGYFYKTWSCYIILLCRSPAYLHAHLLWANTEHNVSGWSLKEGVFYFEWWHTLLA